MDINLRQLQMLREVAERGTMAAAAESLGYTPSAISQQLNALERSTGTDLLERVGRNVRLTDAGRDLVGHAEVMLAELERARVSLESVGTEPRGPVSLAIVESLASTVLPRLLEALTNEHPEVELWTRQLEPHDAYTAIQLGELDLTFDMAYPHAPAPQPEGLVRTNMFNDWFSLVVPEDDELEGTVDLSDLSDRPFIASPPTSCGRCVTMACREAGFEPELRHQVDDYPATLRLVAGHGGIALVPELGLTVQPPGIRVLELKVPVRRTVGITSRENASERPAVAAVV
ncbi:MAG: LysR family transcriptional regulator, partial [Acidimicrobiales bacterium]